MKRPAALVLEIEKDQARIAGLRKERARIDQEISNLVATNKALIVQLVSGTVEQLDLSRLPVRALVSPLAMLGEDVEHRAERPLQEEAAIETFVKIGRNVSSSNRLAHERAGLHSHGRDPAGWKGTVTASQLAERRHHFGERVERPEQAGVGEDPKVLPEAAPAPASVDVRAIGGLVGERQGEPLTAEPESPLPALERIDNAAHVWSSVASTGHVGSTVVSERTVPEII